MVSWRLFLGLFLVGFLTLGCVQSSSNPSVHAGNPTPAVIPSIASPSPTPSIMASVSPVPSIAPSEGPSPSAVAVVADIPTLEDFAKSFNNATQKAFNDSRVAYTSASDVWVVDHTTNDYQYTIFIRPSKTRNWGAFDVVSSVRGASGLEKNVSLVQGESGPYYKYDLNMKCYNAHYDVELVLLDYTFIPGTSQYRRTLGNAVMLTLADACPN